MAAPIRFRTPDEIRARPNWIDGLDHLAHPLDRIIGDYAFAKRDEWACGLARCRRPHQHGYLVLTKDGLETHIGRNCGETHFGVTWGEMEAAFTRARQDQDLKEWLESMLADRDRLLVAAHSLLEGMSIAVEKAKGILADLRKEPAIHQAFLRALRAQGNIQVEREIDVATAERMGIAQAQRRYLETVARLDGHQAIATDRFIGETIAAQQHVSKLRSHVIPLLSELSNTKLRALNPRQRKAFAGDVSGAKTDIDAAHTALDVLHAFLNPANIARLAHLDVPRPTQRAERILKRLAAVSDT